MVEFFVPGLEKFQVQQREKNHLHMLLIISGDANVVRDKVEKRINEILSDKKLNDYVRFSSEVVKDIPLDSKTGKFKLILPYKR